MEHIAIGGTDDAKRTQCSSFNNKFIHYLHCATICVSFPFVQLQRNKIFFSVYYEYCIIWNDRQPDVIPRWFPPLGLIGHWTDIGKKYRQFFFRFHRKKKLIPVNKIVGVFSIGSQYSESALWTYTSASDTKYWIQKSVQMCFFALYQRCFCNWWMLNELVQRFVIVPLMNVQKTTLLFMFFSQLLYIDTEKKKKEI